MNITEFSQYIKRAFEQEFPEYQTVLDSETGLLEVFDRVSWNQKPSVNVVEVYNMTKGRIPCEETAENILQAYHIRLEEENQEQKEETALHPENIIFIAVNKAKHKERQVFLDKGDVILLFGILDANGEFQPLTDEGNVNIDEIYRHAVENLRRDFPCRCIPLCDYAKGHPEEMAVSASSGKDIYVLCCENESFAYSSTGLYYSAKEIKELSEQTGKDFYVFRCSVGLTLLCPCEAFTREEAAELMERLSEERPEQLSSEALIYAGGRLQRLPEYQPRASTKAL